MAKKIFIKTFGCQMNEYDSNRIYDSVKKIGFKKTDDQKNADCFVLNTCHIRDKAKEKVYHEIGRVKKNFKLKEKHRFLDQELNRLLLQQSDLRSEINKLQTDKEYIEKIAREKFMMVKPGEKVFRVIESKQIK